MAGLAGMALPATVEAQAPGAARSFSTTSVTAGGEIEIMVDPSGYGRFGQVVETLPEGFTYVSSTLPGVATAGQDVVITFLEGEMFSYKVTAPATTGVRVFSGVLRDEHKAETPVAGQNQVTVVVDVLARYDANGDGAINKTEYLAALDDFIDGLIDKAALLEVLDRLIDHLASGS